MGGREGGGGFTLDNAKEVDPTKPKGLVMGTKGVGT